MKIYERLVILCCIVTLSTYEGYAKHIGIVKIRENCISENAACKIENTDAGSNLLSQYNQTNRIGCFDRCLLSPKCQKWTWWGDTEHCQLFTKCQLSLDLCKDCITGPRSCGIQEQSVSAVSGGVRDTITDPNQNIIYMIKEDKICEQPAFMNKLTEMPRSRWGHISAFIESKFFLCGGSTYLDGSMAPTDTCDAFCVARQDWVEMSNMTEKRHSAVGVSLFGKMYVLGGHNGVTVTKSVEVYNPSKHVWAKSVDMPVALKGHCSVTFSDSIIVMGGTMENGRETNYVFQFNVTSNKWWHMKPMLNARSGHGCSINARVTVHNRINYEIIVTGGESAGDVLSSTELFDLNTWTWSPFTDLPYKMANHAQTYLGDPILFGGDVSGSASNLILQYNNKDWNMANVSLPMSLKNQHVTKYPANLVKC